LQFKSIPNTWTPGIYHVPLQPFGVTSYLYGAEIFAHKDSQIRLLVSKTLSFIFIHFAKYDICDYRSVL